MSSEEKKCQECQQSTVTDKGDWNYYWLIKGNSKKLVCPNCFHKNQETYKQEYEQIAGQEGNEQKFIKAKCRIKGCGKSFLVDEIENERHNWQLFVEATTEGTHGTEHVHRLDEDDHYDLNQDPTPVNSMEELVHLWMKRKGLVKLKYADSMEIKTYSAEDTSDEDAGSLMPGASAWGKRVLEWLKTQPNRETVRKRTNSTNNLNNQNIDNRERESNSDEINQLENEIRQLESIANPNAEQKKQLTDKKQKLSELKKQTNQKPNNWTPWIIGGLVGGGLIIGLVVYFLWFKKKENHEQN